MKDVVQQCINNNEEKMTGFDSSNSIAYNDRD